VGPMDEDVLMFVDWLAEDRGVIVAPQQVRPCALTVREILRLWRPVSVPQKLRAGDTMRPGWDVTMFSGWRRGGGLGLRLVFVVDFGEWRGIVVV